MQPDLNFNRFAAGLIEEGRFEETRLLLEGEISRMPPGWKPVRETAESLQFAFWDREEFFSYSQFHYSSLTKTVVWIDRSYSKAWYELAVIASKQDRPEHALFCIDCGLQLEPDHPELWNERGYVLGRLKRYHESLENYIRAASVREWAPGSQVARALRGQGVQLVDLDRLDEAEAALRRSLEIDPESKVARNELEYIDGLRQKRAQDYEKLPWFLHSLVNPPADPLTIQLIELVDGLPSIPGPQTVGPENYSRISDAFVERGWAGFEEEFDRIVPRERPDYADVKRDLLREPLFFPRAHENLARVMLGIESVSDLFKRLESRTKPDPQ